MNPRCSRPISFRSEVCNDIKRSFEEASIDTYTILLGNQFRDAGGQADAETPDALKIEMATASMQVLRALTGDASSRLVSGLPYASEFDCAQWSDEQPADRDGAIIAIDDLDRLAVQLLEVVDVAANSLAEWTTCGLASVGDRRSAPLPAGRLIDSIVAYPRTTSIEGYEIVTADGVPHREPGTGTEPAPAHSRRSRRSGTRLDDRIHHERRRWRSRRCLLHSNRRPAMSRSRLAE